VRGSAASSDFLSGGEENSSGVHVAVSSFGNPPDGLFDYQINFTSATPVDLLDASIDGAR
jgi:hypothetical protein